ncbi:MAG: hypothetical protein HQL68_07190 [Magnetococcales bacterium]|nr:hypothetical protein [Magnetococcales bacterium]
MIVLLLPLGVNLFLKSSYYNDQGLKRLAAEKPQDFFLGNSILASRIDIPLLKKLLPQRKISFAAYSASKPNLWYRIIKNDLIASGARPETIIFFLFGNELLQPISLPSQGNHALMAMRKSVANEPIVKREMLASHPLLTVKYFLMSLYAIQSLHNDINWYLTNLTMFLSQPSYREALLERKKANHMRIRAGILDSVNKLMERTGSTGVSQMAEIGVNGQFIQRLDFADALPRSYLPEILELLNSHGILPVFIQVNSLHRLNRQGEVFEFDRLLHRELGQYLSAHGAVYIDESEDSVVSSDMFADLTHIHNSYKAYYTKYFVRRYGDKCSDNFSTESGLKCQSWRFLTDLKPQRTTEAK